MSTPISALGVVNVDDIALSTGFLMGRVHYRPGYSYTMTPRSTTRGILFETTHPGCAPEELTEYLRDIALGSDPVTAIRAGFEYLERRNDLFRQ